MKKWGFEIKSLMTSSCPLARGICIEQLSVVEPVNDRKEGSRNPTESGTHQESVTIQVFEVSQVSPMEIHNFF